MDFHGINMAGIFYIEYQSELPVYENKRDYRRFIFVPEGGEPSLYYGGMDKWMKVSVQTSVNHVMNGGTGVNFIPFEHLVVGDGGNRVKFIKPEGEGNVLTVKSGKWTSLPVNTEITCSEKADIQTHNGVNPDTLKMGTWLNPHRVLVSDPSANVGLRWSDLFDDNKFCKMGFSNFSGLGGETIINNPFDTEPRFIFITISPTTEQMEQIGSIGEYWTRKDTTRIFVGNTGSAKCRFLWLAIK